MQGSQKIELSTALSPSKTSTILTVKNCSFTFQYLYYKMSSIPKKSSIKK